MCAVNLGVSLIPTALILVQQTPLKMYLQRHAFRAGVGIPPSPKSLRKCATSTPDAMYRITPKTPTNELQAGFTVVAATPAFGLARKVLSL